jgi:methylated-DNA-protein-cysteine methyltransferase-like protein
MPNRVAKKKSRASKRERFAWPQNFYEAVYRVVVLIPRGRVMTYGQIAVILGAPRAARAVGYAMRACPENIPWQRVINGKGQISARSQVERPVLQKLLLETEGIKFDKTDTCDLDRLRWDPADPERFYYRGSDRMPFD